MLRKLSVKFHRILPIIILTVLPLILFHQVLQSQVIVTGDFSGSDLLDLHLPFKYALHQAIVNKNLPLWNKDMAMGFPVLAEGQTGVFFPTNLIFSLLPPIDALDLSVMAVFAVSALTAYLFFRSLKKSITASIYGAIIFAFSGYFITRFKHLNLVNSASLFPLMLYAAHEYFESTKLRFVVLSAVTFALMIFAGHPQITYYNTFMFIIFCCYLAYKKYKSDKTKAITCLINITLVSILLGVLLSAVQIIPTLELTLKSPRAITSESPSGLYPFGIQNLMTFISPYYFGNPADATYNKDIRTFGIFWENTTYISLAGILFALVMIARILLKKDSKDYNRFFLFFGLFSLLLMFGPSTPLFPLLYKYIPLMNLFRFPNRFNLYLIFSLAYLSIGGMEFAVETIIKRTQFRAKNISTKSSEDQVQINWPFSKSQTMLMISAFTFLDLIVFGYAYIGYLPKNEVTKAPELVSQVSENSQMYRTFSITQYTDNPYSALGWKKSQDAILASRKTLPPNNNLLFDIPYFNDRGWFEGGLSISRRNTVENYLLNSNPNPYITTKVLGTYSVKYILSYSDLSGFEINKIKDFELGKDFAAKLNLYQDDLAIPRLSYVPEAEYQPDENKVFSEILTLDQNPAKSVIVEDKPTTIPPQFKGSLDEFKNNNPVKFMKDTNSEITISAEIKNHGFLLLNDIYYPGWKVFVDGKEDKILRANYLVRAVELNPGKHEVRFIYDPLSFKVGAGLTLGTIILLTASFGLHQIRSKRKHKS